MSYGSLRLTIERKCPDCGEVEEIRTTKYTEEHRELVLDEETSRDFSSGFEHGRRCSYDGPARITTKIHSVEAGLPLQLRQMKLEARREVDTADDEIAHAAASARLQALEDVTDLDGVRKP